MLFIKTITVLSTFLQKFLQLILSHVQNHFSKFCFLQAICKKIIIKSKTNFENLWIKICKKKKFFIVLVFTYMWKIIRATKQFKLFCCDCIHFSLFRSFLEKYLGLIYLFICIFIYLFIYLFIFTLPSLTYVYFKKI